MEIKILDLNIDPVQQDGLDRFRIEIPGEAHGGRQGWPDLPHISRFIVVPPTAAIEVEWSGESGGQLFSGQPVTVPHENRDGTQTAMVDLDYASRQELYPSKVVEVADPAIMRGTRIVNVTVNPVQIDPQTGETKVWSRIRVKLNFTNSEAINPVINPERPRPSRNAVRLLEDLVLNPAEIRRDDSEQRGTFVYVVPDFETEIDDEMVHVADVVAPLANWRRRQGYPTEIMIIAENASNVALKEALEDAYFEWDIPPENITLVGDADLVFADFMIPTWDIGRVYMWETDYKYALLEGNDLLPEVAISRISARNIPELERTIQDKILAYETHPQMEDENGEDDTAWFKRAGLMANDPRTGYSSVYLQRWLRKMLLEVGFTEVDTVYWIHGVDQDAEHDFIADNINNQGISLLNYRGWGQFNGCWSPGDADELRNGSKLPLFILPTCNTGDFADHILEDHAYGEELLWGQRGGAIGTIGASGFTHTNYNNVFAGGVLNSLYRDDIWQIGWALNRGKLEMYRHFGMFNDVIDPQVQALLVWEAHAYQLNLIGDGGTELWTDVPQLIDVECPDTLKVGVNTITVSVTERGEDGGPVEGVTLTILNGEELLRIDDTPPGGVVEFTFTLDELDDGMVLDLTASKHNVYPYMGQIVVETADVFLGVSSFIIDDDNAGRSRGNGNGEANPGETIELRTFIANMGEDVAEGRVDVSLEMTAGNAEITVGEGVINNAPGAGDSSLVTFVVSLDAVCCNNQRTVFHVTAVSGEIESSSAIEFLIAAPDLEYVSHSFEPDPFNPEDTAWVEVTLNNIGQLTSPVMIGRLISGRKVVNVFDDVAEFASIEIDDEDNRATARFRIHAHSLTVPGTSVDMRIELLSEDGFVDETGFSFTVGTPRDGTPFGPDAYGYVCFDDTDEAWEDVVPEFDWVEIDPDLDGPGTDTGIRDQINEEDWTELIQFPEGFGFQYYGQEFDRVSICSNGWFAFGYENLLADFQNRRIPPALGPRAQVCVFWDDLISYYTGNPEQRHENQIGGVYYWFDEENHRFIIEWSRMHRYVGLDHRGNPVPGGLNTFQVILYDPQHYPTYTRDGNIVFQYLTVNNDAAVDPAEFDTPYATVGIVNLNGTDGMEYTYWNEYPAGAAPLADGRAIKFSTVLFPVVGFVEGEVTDAETGMSIAGAEIRGEAGSFARTDNNGRYRMENVLVDTALSFTAWAPGYNDSTLSGYDLLEDSTLTIDFSLLHPDFEISEEEIDIALQPDAETTIEIQLSNTGTGPLDFRSFFDYEEGEDDELWNRMLNFDATEPTGDWRIRGVNFFAGRLWVTGSNNGGNPNKFYIFNSAGNLVSTIDQPGNSNYGFWGTTVDPARELLYGGEQNLILGVDDQGTPRDTVQGPMNSNRALAFQKERSVFWVANGVENPIFEIDSIGNILNTYDHELDIKGLGYFSDDPDGYPLYIVSADKTHPALQVPEALVSKFDPVSGDMRVVAVLEGEFQERVAGMEVINTFDHQKWVMAAIIDSRDGQRVSVYDMGPNTRWVSYAPRFGHLNAGEETTINFNINADGLLSGEEFSILVRYIHNAAGLETVIPIGLTVDSTASVPAGDDGLPLEFKLSQNYPNPFNPSTVIPFSLPSASWAKLAVFDITGREVMMLINDRLPAGNHNVEFDAGKLPSGIYLIRLEAAQRTAFRKLALVR